MAKSILIFMLAFFMLTHAIAARNIPHDQTKPTDDASAPAGNQENLAATAVSPAANGVEDQKNFITFGGVGGWSGIAGVIPVFGGIGGLGGAGGLGGLGGAGGLGGLGGAGGLGGLGGAGGGGALPLP